MASRSDSGRIKPGITVDRDTWEKFKEKYKDNASQQVENLMRMAAEADKIGVYNASGLDAVAFSDPQDWNVSYTAGHLNVSHCSADDSVSGGTTSNPKVTLSWTQPNTDMKKD